VLDFTKPVQTKDGRKVRILCTDAPGDYPVVGLLGNTPYSWTIDGKYNRGLLVHDLRDLVNAPRKEYRVVSPWVDAAHALALGLEHGGNVGGWFDIPLYAEEREV